MYTAYNLIIRSELELPELIGLDSESELKPDVSIYFEFISKHGLAEGKQIGPFLWANKTSLWLQVPNIARFLVRNGCEIAIDPEPNSDPESIRLFLLGSAMGALLFQRGFLVLHGNAIQIDNQALICAGNSGIGKSTLAAGFMRRNYPILADDIVAIDANCRVLPGFPRLKLWQDVTTQLQIDTTNLVRIRPHLEKFNLPLHHSFATTSVPVRWIYILHSDNKLNAFTLTRISGMDCFAALQNNTYRLRFLTGMQLNTRHLQSCSKLAANSHIVNLVRPSEGFELDALIDRILTDISANP